MLLPSTKHRAMRLPILASVVLVTGCLKDLEAVEGSGSTTEVGSTETGEPTTTTGGGSCGDGVVDIGEGCDDGNAGEGDGCPSGAVGQCKAEAACGDGVVWAGMEECDDGNMEDLDACNDMCAAPRWVFVTSNNGYNGNLGGVLGAV